MTELNFSEQVGVVTGAGRTLGRAYALELARRGAHVVVNDWGGVHDPLNDEDRRADTVVAEILDAGGTAVASHEDVATEEGSRAVVDAALEHWGRVDIVINNAGFLRPNLIEDLTPERFDAVVAVHLRASYLVTRAAWSTMKSQAYGRVVLTGSSAGAFGHQGQANYAAAKGGILGLARALAYEGSDCGIAVNVVQPYANSPIAVEQPVPDLWENFTKHVPGDVHGLMMERSDPDYTTALVLVLVSRECNVTGEFYSSCVGRYARIFTGLTHGWLADEGTMPSAEEVFAHWDEIRDLRSFTVPAHLYEEVAEVTNRLGAMKGRRRTGGVTTS